MTFEFATQYTPHSRVFTEPGVGDKIIYSSKYDEFGNLELEESGKEDFYGYIQSFKDSCDIGIIMQRYANGDISALTKRQGVFMDISGYSKNPMDALNLVIAAEEHFNGLPVEERAKYDHSFSKWLAGLGTVSKEISEQVNQETVSTGADKLAESEVKE